MTDPPPFPKILGLVPREEKNIHTQSVMSNLSTLSTAVVHSKYYFLVYTTCSQYLDYNNHQPFVTLSYQTEMLLYFCQQHLLHRFAIQALLLYNSEASLIILANTFCYILLYCQINSFVVFFLLGTLSSYV